MSNETRSASITFRCTPSMLKKLERIAENERRSLSQVIEMFLEKALSK